MPDLSLVLPFVIGLVVLIVVLFGLIGIVRACTSSRRANTTAS